MQFSLSKIIQILVAAICFAIAAFFCSLPILASASGDWLILLFATPVSAFLIAAILWTLFITISEKTTVWRGVLIGVLTGILSHPFAWFIASVFLYLTNAASSLGERTLNPLEAIFGSLLFSVFSLLFLGWLTIPIGALIGGILAYVSRRSFWESVKADAGTLVESGF
jgi:hypothetical protein